MASGRANIRRLRAALVAMRAHGTVHRFGMLYYFISRDGVHDSLAAVPRDLATTDPTCEGVTACPAGWCQLLGAVSLREKRMHAHDFAAGWIGIGLVHASRLFVGAWIDKPLSEITVDDAIAELERLDHAA